MPTRHPNPTPLLPGQTYHIYNRGVNRETIFRERDNDLKADGWQVLHFGTRHIMEETATYCVPKILETIDTLGGTDDGTFVPRRIARTWTVRGRWACSIEPQSPILVAGGHTDDL